MEMTDHPYLYLGSLEEAKQHDEVQDWKKSFRCNIHCAKAVEDTIRRGFDGRHLSGESAKNVIEEYGFKRLAFVLANTLQEKGDDGRFSSSNKDWAKDIHIPKERDLNYMFAVQSHPAVLDGFINLYRKELDALQMFDRTHCETLTG